MGNLLQWGLCSADAVEEMLVYKECSSSNGPLPLSTLPAKSVTRVIAWNIYNPMSRKVFPDIMENASNYILYCTEE